MPVIQAIYEIWRTLMRLSPGLVAQIVLLVREVAAGEEDKAVRRAKATASRAASEALIRERMKRSERNG
jgi:hypothetical protein